MQGIWEIQKNQTRVLEGYINHSKKNSKFVGNKAFLRRNTQNTKKNFKKMVLLHIKRETESQFLYETSKTVPISELVSDIVNIYNGRLKIKRVASEVEELAKHGPMFPPDILGLLEEQAAELKLHDEWADKVVPSGGWIYNKDPMGRRNGRMPQANMQAILTKAIKDAQEIIDKEKVIDEIPLKFRDVQDALGVLKGAVSIVYPMQLPPHDIIQMELTNTEDLSGTQAAREIVEPAVAQIWFAGRQFIDGKRLLDYLGANEKCKVIVKLVKCGEGAPGREPIFNDEAQKKMMLQAYQRQEELKRLDDDEDDSYLNSKWANSSNLKQKLHGVENISFRFK